MPKITLINTQEFGSGTETELETGERDQICDNKERLADEIEKEEDKYDENAYVREYVTKTDHMDTQECSLYDKNEDTETEMETYQDEDMKVEIEEDYQQKTL